MNFVNEKYTKNREGIEIKNNSQFEIIHFSLGKNIVNTKKATGAILVAAKLILPQNNFDEGSSSKKIINMLKFHNANAHERIENEILIRFWGSRLRKIKKPIPVLIEKAIDKNMFVVLRTSS